MLKLLERFPVGDTRRASALVPRHTNEAMIEADAAPCVSPTARCRVGDEDFVHVPKKGLA